MGEVYRARDPKLGRDVAIKVLPQAFAREPDRMARFQREARVLASLSHPNIATIYGLEDSGETRALVMELVEGPTLADRIKQGPIPVDEAIRIARQIADALEYAHERGIIHRDLKPANVKVNSDDTVKVLDFGLAKALEGDRSSIDISTSPTISRIATHAGVLLGTAAYMSPEQAKAKSVDRRADIWAFGCVLYEMLTGKMAFHGEAITDTLAAVIRAEPDWSLLPATTPMRVRVLLQRCLQKDPKQRLRDIGDARISLDEVLSEAPDVALGPRAPGAMQIGRRALPWAIASVCLMIAFAALAWSYLRVAGGRAPTGEPMRFQVSVPEKAFSAYSGVFGLSPDGRKLAFFASGSDGVYRVWVRDMDSLEARPLADSASPQAPPFFWSLDSRYITFDAGGKLKKIDVSGGPAQTLCDVGGLVVGGSWNRDGVIIFGQAPGPLMRVSANGGPASAVTALDSSRGDLFHDFPFFLPDGQHFIYRVTSSKPGKSGVYIGSLDVKPREQDPQQLMAADFAAVYVPPLGSAQGQLLFVRDGTLMTQPFDANQLQLAGDASPVAEGLGFYRSFSFFSASANGVLAYRAGGAGVTQLTWYDREGKVLSTVGEPGTYLTVTLSPDGARAAVGRLVPQASNPAIWLVDLARGTSARFTFGLSSANVGTWSPDGSRIVFDSSPSFNGASDLYRKLASGVGDEEPLLKSNSGKFPTSWSRDGRFLLYTADAEKRSLWVLPVEGERKPFPFLQTDFDNSDGQFSPDGHWVAYVSNESGHDEIYIRTFSPDSKATASDTSGKWLISVDGGSQPRWRGDSKELYYLGPNGMLMAVEIATSPVFRAGVPKSLFQTPPRTVDISVTMRQWDLTSDGKRFLFPAPTEQTGVPFTVVLNWQATLKK
jgi:Tol biopolymer transport system component